MKNLLLLTLIICLPLLSYSQDTIRTSRGYNIDYKYLYLRVDTVHNITQAVSYFRGVHSFSIKIKEKYLHKNMALRYRNPFTIYGIHGEIIVERKNYQYICKY